MWQHLVLSDDLYGGRLELRAGQEVVKVGGLGCKR